VQWYTYRAQLGDPPWPTTNVSIARTGVNTSARQRASKPRWHANTAVEKLSVAATEPRACNDAVISERRIAERYEDAVERNNAQMPVQSAKMARNPTSAGEHPLGEIDRSAGSARVKRLVQLRQYPHEYIEINICIRALFVTLMSL
jgi:hypothetical protein